MDLRTAFRANVAATLPATVVRGAASAPRSC